jgi:GT2 family glycosyltransferase
VLEARGELLAFTDDDVSVDAGWVHGLVRGFRRRPDTACVTGLVASASIENVAEAYFDARVSWSDVQTPRTYDLRTGQSEDALFPYSPGIFGTGANLALRTDVIRQLGGFDEALGAGTRTRGGEDLDIFIRVLRGGYALVHEPSALVWHHHRADMEALSQQMYAYGTGFTALFAKLMADRSTRWDLLRRVPTGVSRFLRVGKTTSQAAPSGVRMPRALLLQEVKGMAHGPLLYVQARRRVPHRADHSQP